MLSLPVSKVTIPIDKLKLSQFKTFSKVSTLVDKLK